MALSTAISSPVTFRCSAGTGVAVTCGVTLWCACAKPDGVVKYTEVTSAGRAKQTAGTRGAIPQRSSHGAFSALLLFAGCGRIHFGAGPTTNDAVAPDDANHDTDALAMDSRPDAPLPDGPLSDLTCPQGEACLTFESGPTPGTVACPDGSYGAAATNTPHGSRALRIAFNDGAASYCGSYDLIAPTTDIWVRSWVRPTGSAGYANIFGVTTADQTNADVSIFSGGTTLHHGATQTNDSRDLIPFNTWTCVELHTQISGTALTMTLYTSGTQRMMAAGSVAAGQQIVEYSLAWYADTALRNYVLWLDNTVVSRTRIPCT